MKLSVWVTRNCNMNCSYCYEDGVERCDVPIEEAGISTLSISANGSITLCPAIEDSNIVLGTVDELDNIEQILMKMQQTCIVEEVSPCNSCNVRYFCSSKCYATNINIFNNFSLREQRCKQYKKKLQKYVWE